VGYQKLKIESMYKDYGGIQQYILINGKYKIVY